MTDNINTTYNKESDYIRLVFDLNKKDLFRLMYMCKFYGIDYKKIPKYLKHCAKEKINDASIITWLVKKTNQIHYSTPCNNRGRNRATDVFDLLMKIDHKSGLNTEFATYLDIGAGDCEITKHVADLLCINKKNVYAVDIKTWSNKENKSDDFENYIYIDEPDEQSEFNIGIDKKFDIITIFQSLHHMKNYKNVIKKLYNLISDNGIIIIREHDAINDETKILCHIEHLLYGILADGMSFNGFCEEYYGNYMSKKNMIYIFIQEGFKPLSSISKINPTRHYYQAFKKI